MLDYLVEFSYVGLFLVLLATGFGLPLPEEAALVTAGFLVYKDYMHFWPTMVAGFAGVVMSDVVVYLFGRFWGSRILTWRHLPKLVKSSRIDFIRRFYAAHGGKTILLARYMPGFRMPAFFTAGSCGMTLGRFLLLDLVAASISVPLAVGFGHLFGNSIERAVHRLRHFEVVFIAIGLFVIIWLVLREVFKARK